MGKENASQKNSTEPDQQRRSARIVARAPLPIVEVRGKAHVISYVNLAFCGLLKKPREELIGIPFAEILPGDDECLPVLDRIYETGEAITLAGSKEAEPAPAQWLYAMWPSPDPEEGPVGVIIQLTRSPDFRHDTTAINEALLIAGLHQHELKEMAEKLNEQLQNEITERMLAEDRRNEYSNKLEVMSRELVEAQETERRHLARELHDEIGQALTGVQLQLQAMLQMRISNAMAKRLEGSLMVIARVMEQVQDISLNLRPSILDDLGLGAALQWLTRRQAANSGLKAKVLVKELSQRPDTMIETACFRVAQEALTNVARHAKAKCVTVELGREGGQLHLRVRDDGAGFEAASLRKKSVQGESLGLLNMEERALLAGGQLEFKSAPGQGTEVHAWFPLKPKNSHD